MDEEKRKTGGFVLGAGLIVLGIADAVINPFDPITPIELITAGGALVMASVGKGRISNEKYR